MGQVAANILYIAAPDFYSGAYPYLATFFGINIIGAVLMTALTFYFHFCSVSRLAAAVQILFCLVYMVFPDRELYNLVVQILVGVAALITTFLNITIKLDTK